MLPGYLVLAAICYGPRVTRVAEIEKAVTELGESELSQFRAWFEAFDAERFDRRLAADAASGKLDWLAEEVRVDIVDGHVRPL